MKVIKGIEYLKQRAIPGHAMFSYNRNTKELEFIDQIEFTAKEVTNGTVKNCEFERHPMKIYLQALSPDIALQKFKLFLNHFNKASNEN